MADTIMPKVPIAISASLKVDDVRALVRSTETVPDAANRIVHLSERADDQDRCCDAIVTQLTHDRDAIDVRKHAIDRDHGIVAGDATAQRLIASGGKIHLVAAGRERIHQLTGGFRVVFNDQNTAVTSRHGFRSPKDWSEKPNSSGLMTENDARVI